MIWKKPFIISKSPRKKGTPWRATIWRNVTLSVRASSRISSQAAVWYTQAAEKNNLDSMVNLGICYTEGLGVEQNYEKAFYWFDLAAGKGYAAAEYNLGLCYLNGEGVEKDEAKAVDYFTRAAKQELSDAQYTLALCCRDGIGTAKDDEQYKYWLEKAASHGQEEAVELLNA